MRKLYARYTDDRFIEIAIPNTVHIWTEHPTPTSSPVAPIGWKLEGWEGWIDTQDLRALTIIDDTASTEILAAGGATQQEIADLKKLIAEGQPKQPATLEGGTNPNPENRQHT